MFLMPAVNLDLGPSSFEASTAVSVPNINRKVLCRAHVQCLHFVSLYAGTGPVAELPF